MIIVSQEKDVILNFDNIIGIRIAIDIESNKETRIAIDSIDSERYYIARYSTEERAKEVLQEIIERYTNWNNLVYGQPTGECSPKYEMPKE